VDAEQRNRDNALQDLRFHMGDQWPENIRAEREVDGRPCLTINRLPAFVHQITNDQRQNRPSIQVNPVDDHGDVDTAEVIQGLVRNIEVASDADAAYDEAFISAVICGFGYFRVITQYADPMSFDQEILIRPIKNRFTVYRDPSSKLPDKTDCKWTFIVDHMTLEEFEYQFGEHPDVKANWEEYAGAGDREPDWLDKDGIRIVEYFSVECEEKELVRCQVFDATSNGWQVLDVLADQVPEGAIIQARRKTEVPYVRWSKMTAIDILEERKLPGDIIPVFSVIGEEVDVDGRSELVGLVRFLRDPLAMYNFWVTAETEAIALAPKAPHIGVEGTFEGHEHEWALSGYRPTQTLEYKPVLMENGQMAPPPARQQFEPAVMAITNARMQAAQDLKDVSGIHDASLGARSNETTGVAIRQRQAEGDTSNFHFTDNLARSIKALGRMLVKYWIPEFYDTARVERIIGADDAKKLVKLNQPTEHNGQPKIFDLATGKYDVTISVGPSYQTKRQEATASMVEFARTVPELVPRFADVMVKAMDWPYAQEIAKRIAPPDAQQDGEGPDPAQLQAQLQQAGQQLQLMQQELAQAQQQIQTKSMELSSRERIAALQIQAQLITKEAEINSAQSIEAFRADMTRLTTQLQQLVAAGESDTNAEREAQQQAQMPEAA
jgi:hypothetical protein